MTLAALCLAVAVAAAVQLVSGFGFALVAAPVLVAVTDPVTSVSLLSLLGVVVCALALATSREPREILRRDGATLLAWAAPGVVAGAFVIDRLDEDLVRAAVGVLVLAAIVQRHVLRRRRSGPARPVATPAGVRRATAAAAGLTSGAMTTSTGLNGPPLVLYLTAEAATPRQARDTLAALFLVLDSAAVAALAAAGNLHLPDETFALPVAGLAGVLLGHRVFDRLSDHARQVAITAMLVVAALTALGAALA